MSALAVLAAVVFGVVVGAFAALLGIGGGGLMVAFIVLGLDKGQHLAEGTSLLVMIPIAVSGVVAHRRKGFVDLGTAAVIGIGGALGAVLGASVALALDAELLTRLFGVVLVLVGVRVVRQARVVEPGKHPDQTDRTN